jgi:heme/copper-type cytochrome/quinol oxidase subunit 3
LTLLIVSEFAFFLTAIGAYFGIRQVQADGIKPLNVVITLFCILLSVGFLWLGITLWPFST